MDGTDGTQKAYWTIIEKSTPVGEFEESTINRWTWREGIGGNSQQLETVFLSSMNDSYKLHLVLVAMTAPFLDECQGFEIMSISERIFHKHDRRVAEKGVTTAKKSNCQRLDIDAEGKTCPIFTKTKIF